MKRAVERIPTLFSRALEIPLNLVLNGIDPPTLVLLYHRVSSLPSDPLGLAVTPERFRAQLRYLQERFAFRRFEEPWPPSKQPTVVITFDDGYADNFLEALPILEAIGVPATFFISTEAIGSEREYWWDDLERLVLLPGKRPECFESQDSRVPRTWPTREVSERERLYWELQKLLKGFDFRRREAWLRDLRDWSGLPEAGRETHRPLTLEKLRRLAESPLATIGAHTVTHTRLSILPSEVQEAEIKGSKEILERWLEQPVTVFSYPFGECPDFTPNAVRYCEATFVKTAAVCSKLARSWSHPHRIPRRYVGNWEASALRHLLT